MQSHLLCAILLLEQKVCNKQSDLLLLSDMQSIKTNHVYDSKGTDVEISLTLGTIPNSVHYTIFRLCYYIVARGLTSPYTNQISD